MVVGDFQPSESLNGFFLQQPDRSADADPGTSEGLFIFEGGSQVAVTSGDLVRVSGQVTEFPEDRSPSMTQLTSVTAVLRCGRETLPRRIDLDWLDQQDSALNLESHEGMRVRVIGPLAVTATDNLGRFGEVVLSGRSETGDPFFYSATEVNRPGSELAIEREEQNRKSLILDDGSAASDLERVPYLSEATPLSTTSPSAALTLRRGDTTPELEGIVAVAFASYRLHPLQEPVFQRALPRSQTPPPVGGEIRVASMNVLNYFLTLDDGENDARGADSQVEFSRQQSKIVAALCGLDADIVSLVEVENNGDARENSAVASLAKAVNKSCDLKYSWIQTGTLGGSDTQQPDVITVGMLYRPARVVALGSPAVLVGGTFGQRSRPPIAQTFRSAASESAPAFTVVANHFKSKSCRDASEGDADQGDGQACYNQTRVQSARELMDWLATDPTSSGSDRLLILGDLNANSFEDPVMELEGEGEGESKGKGLVNLLKRFVPQQDRYTFVFRGEASSLDHALVSPALEGDVTGAAVWHINADEPRALDYEDEIMDSSSTPDRLNKDVRLFREDAFRSSDHDPVIVGLSFQ